MKRLFTPEGGRAIAALAAAEPLLAFDFDGTLAPIVARPDDARVPPPLAEQLARLAALRPVAVVTGRSIADATPRLGFAPRWVVGSHGAEGPEGVLAIDADDLAALTVLRERLLGDAALRAAGVEVEDKGHSLALHYRRAPEHATAVAAIDGALYPLDAALKTFGGKCVVNVVAAGAPDKGDAVAALAARCGARAAFFIGDDVNDESVYECARPPWLTVRVGCDADSLAMYCVAGQGEVAVVVERLLEVFDRR